jgi:hypothetical protein
MVMAFRTAKADLVQLLGDSAANRYKVVGYAPQPKDASVFLGTNRTIRAFYSGGNFPKGSASLSTPAKHNVNMLLEMVVTASSEVDLGVIEDPNSTDAQRIAAMASTTPAAQIADESFDEFLDIVWNVLMDSRNKWLGGEKYKVGDRWVPDFKKDKIIPMGNYVIVTGYIRLDFNIEEKADGETPTAFSHNITDFSPIDGDTTQGTEQRT